MNFADNTSNKECSTVATFEVISDQDDMISPLLAHSSSLSKKPLSHQRYLVAAYKELNLQSNSNEDFLSLSEQNFKQFCYNEKPDCDAKSLPLFVPQPEEELIVAVSSEK
jgi:hypothetical protein